MKKSKIKKETNEFIFKYQKEDINEKLGRILGNEFKQYRKDFAKTQDGSGFVPEFPITVSLELVNRCNLDCIMCYKEHHRQERSELSLKDLEKIFKECKENKLASIILGLGAETLVYKDVKKVIPMISEAGIMDVFFGTNGVLLTEEISELIVKNKLSRVEISLDAATPQTYKKVRGHDRLEMIERNIEKLLEIKKKYKSELPVIRLCFVVMDINNHETQKFIDKWQDKVDYIDFQRCVDFSQIGKPAKVEKKVIENSFCSYPFYSLNVWSDGGISPCCSFYGEKLKFGNIKKDSLKDVWNSPAMKKIREDIIAKKFNPVCQKCLYFRDRELIDKNF